MIVYRKNYNDVHFCYYFVIPEVSYSEHDFNRVNIGMLLNMFRVKLLTCDRLDFVVGGILSDFRQSSYITALRKCSALD